MLLAAQRTGANLVQFAAGPFNAVVADLVQFAAGVLNALRACNQTVVATKVFMSIAVVEKDRSSMAQKKFTNRSCTTFRWTTRR